MAAGARPAGLSVSQSAELPGLSHWHCVSPQDLLDGSKKGKYPVAGSGGEKNPLSLSAVGGERSTLTGDHREATVAPVTAGCTASQTPGTLH